MLNDRSDVQKSFPLFAHREHGIFFSTLWIVVNHGDDLFMFDNSTTILFMPKHLIYRTVLCCCFGTSSIVVCCACIGNATSSVSYFNCFSLPCSSTISVNRNLNKWNWFEVNWKVMNLPSIDYISPSLLLQSGLVFHQPD